METKSKGSIGEILAERYLNKLGYKFVARNYFCKLGEIDLIYKDKDYYVFIEVKARLNDRFGQPREAINQKKQQKIKRVAEFYLISNKIYDKNCRFDCIEVLGNEKDYKLEHYKNAF